jgi:hypothetical protein
MRVFYSHPKKLYGTEAERREIALIRKRFIGCEVVEPSSLQSGAEPGRETEYYLKLVDTCDCLVFSRHFGNVTQGVKPEVEHALSTGKEVYELRGGRFMQIKAPVTNLPITERLILRAKGALGIGHVEPA